MKYKIIFSLATVLLFVSCVNQRKPLQTPAWYHSQTMQVEGSTKYLGYGDAKTLFEAKSIAKEEIAQSLISHIDSSFISKIEVKKKKNQETYNTQTKHNLKVTTKIDLQNLSVLKQEYLNGRYFILLEYENLDLTYRIKKSVTDVECGDVNKYIKSTPLYQTIRSSFSCDVNLKLQRKNSAWYLKYKEKQFLLNSSEFEKLYVSRQSKVFDFKINKSVLQDGDSFYFRFITKKEGYITLLNVYENGIVTLLSESQKIAKSLQIPSKESETYFEAAVVENSRDSSDLYVAFFSEKLLDMSRFAYADDELLSSEVAYKFDELIEMFNTLEYATLIVRISK